jgi:hypothetical protein
MPQGLGGVLPWVYSKGNKLRGLLDDPLGSANNALADANTRAGGLLALTRESANEGLTQGPATNALIGLLADSYNPAGMVDLKALHSAIQQHTSRLDSEAADWASRKYKPNKGQVFFQGDGPTKGESMSIGSINANRRDRNVASRQAQIEALDRVGRVAQSNPALVESEFNEAKRLADWWVKQNGSNYDDALDAMLGQRFTGTQEWSSGAGSVGRAIRQALEPSISAPKPAAAASVADDWMNQLFGN